VGLFSKWKEMNVRVPVETMDLGGVEELYRQYGVTKEKVAGVYGTCRDSKNEITDNPAADNELKEAIFFLNEVKRRELLPPVILLHEILAATDRWFQRVSDKGSK
jgi:hypothetical protein